MEKRNRLNRSRTTLAVAVALIILLLLTAFQAARLGLADFYASPVISYIRFKQNTQTALTQTELQRAEVALRLGSELAPNNPEYLSYPGFLQQLKISQHVGRLPADDLVSIASLATNYYAKAAALRPTWPYDWGNLAVEEYRVGRYTGPVFSDALVLAARFGPWRNDTQLLVAELGSDSFDFLSDEAQRALLDTLNRALARQMPAIVEIINEYGVHDSICHAADAIDTSSSPARDAVETLRYLRQYCGEAL